MLIYGNHLYSANCGDSRAIIVSEGDQKNSIVVKAASRDHKPNEKDEAKRIMAKAGRIEPFKDTIGTPIGPHRVWLKYDDIPGLAMSRSIGDN
jgi:serine/threonine protein phosphatase PrpC